MILLTLGWRVFSQFLEVVLKSLPCRALVFQAMTRDIEFFLCLES